MAISLAMLTRSLVHNLFKFSQLGNGTRSSPTFSKKFLFFSVFIFHFICNVVSSDLPIYSNKWAVEIDGDLDTANNVASQNGFINHGKIFNDERYYLFSHPKLRKRSLRQHDFHHSNIISHEKVNWAEQQLIKSRIKRDFTNVTSYDPLTPPNDPQWENMWYLNPAYRPSMHVTEAWQAGYTGKNISVTVLDDGIERLHPDLRENYDPLSSFDLNQHDSDPTPRYTSDNRNEHGTRCAGVLAASVNNRICMVGIAYNAKLGGVRMLDGDVTDTLEAASFSFRSDYVDIYSVSWGPDDNGRTVEGPGTLARKALINGAKKGRGGKGSVFVWASGNGGHADNCNCDGYASSIYTLSVSSTTRRRTVPWYSELCSSTMATTYSSGADGKIVTTDLRSTCTSGFTGTSVSAPAAAAICALTLEANPNLTWRDVQHLVVQTAQPDVLRASDWVVNGANRKVSHAFGFGLMDAYAMVTKAKTWISVPEQYEYVRPVIYDRHTPRLIPPNSSFLIPVEPNQRDVFRVVGNLPNIASILEHKICGMRISKGGKPKPMMKKYTLALVVAHGNDSDVIDRLEHVQVVLTLRSMVRGDLAVYLTSPAGTKSTLLGRRPLDVKNAGFDEWAFTSVHTWDENPRGLWMLEIQHDDGENRPAELSLFKLVLYGTKQSDWPQHLRISHPPATSTHPVTVSPQQSTTQPLISETESTLNHMTTYKITTEASQVANALVKDTSSGRPKTQASKPSSNHPTEMQWKADEQASSYSGGDQGVNYMNSNALPDLEDPNCKLSSAREAECLGGGSSVNHWSVAVLLFAFLLHSIFGGD